MRKLIICCDGTWNTADQEFNGVPVPTNVRKLFNCLADKDKDGNDQLKYYHPGVGTDGGFLNNLVGGMFGQGLQKNIMSAYHWLAYHYQSGDQICLFGFSRGAFTVRSLTGMMSCCGLIDVQKYTDTDERWVKVETAFKQGYRLQKPRAEWGKGWHFHEGAKTQDIRIHFIGVWDTVGSLGIPDDKSLLNLLLDDPKNYKFHSTSLSKKVTTARHAIAIDEVRSNFTPTLWTDIPEKVDCKQVWFPGVHSDVGGGYLEHGLSDGALQWMIEEASKIGGLGFEEGLTKQIKPNFQDVMHNSNDGAFKLLRNAPRSLPRLDVKANYLHQSVEDRQKSPPITQAPYRKVKFLANKGDVHEQDIFAQQRWNETGVFLEAGVEYEFEATGKWTDNNIKCGPGGTNDGVFYKGEIVQMIGSLFGKLERGAAKTIGNPTTDFAGTKREEAFPWFALIGVVANGGQPGDDGTPVKQETFLIGENATFKPKKPGYLYCFANDAWDLYENNRGSVFLKVKRAG